MTWLPLPGSVRTRLAVGVLLLTALGLLLAATASTLLLRSYLVGQVDAQLLGAPRLPSVTGSATTTPTPGASPTAPGGGLPSPFVLTRLDAAGAVVTQQRGSQVTSAPAPDLGGLGLAEVLARDGVPFDTTGVDDAAYSYRAVARPLADGSGSTVLAMSTEPIDDTVQRAGLASAAVGVLILGLVGLVVGRVVRVGLRPLDDIERSAERIAAGDLGHRVPDFPEGTEVGRLARSLNGMLGQIETAFDERTASEDRLRRFVADASHELRTPLTSIRGYAELSRTGALEGEGRDLAIRRIESEAVRMGLLVDDLLLLARLDQQRPLERTRVDVSALVSDAADAVRAAAPERPVSVDLPDLPAYVVADPARLRQVVDNLAANARLHTAAGGPIGLTVSSAGPDGPVRISVSDRGPGMCAEDSDHAFERFYRGDPSRTRVAGGGSGLGLSIAQAIVTSLGGGMELVTSPESGTTVTVSLSPAPPPPVQGSAAGGSVRALQDVSG